MRHERSMFARIGEDGAKVVVGEESILNAGKLAQRRTARINHRVEELGSRPGIIRLNKISIIAPTFGQVH